MFSQRERAILGGEKLRVDFDERRCVRTLLFISHSAEKISGNLLASTAVSLNLCRLSRAPSSGLQTEDTSGGL
jgi:hypothetical protein